MCLIESQTAASLPVSERALPHRAELCSCSLNTDEDGGLRYCWGGSALQLPLSKPVPLTLDQFVVPSL